MGLFLPTTADAAQRSPGPAQWTLDASHFDVARIWPLSTGSKVIVAIIDSGVDAHHPDLATNVLPGADFTGHAADGRLDTSSDGHGTAVAAIIAGTGHTSEGITGLAPDATILPVRVSDDLASDPAALAQGIDYATRHRATVINISTCAAILNPQVRAAIDAAIQHDVVVIAAAGNNGLTGNPPQYPAAIPGVVAVAASDTSNNLWPKNESGPYLGLTAPGVDIYTAGPQGSHQHITGTSFAAPHVAAVAALLRARYPRETAAQIINRMTSTAKTTDTNRNYQSGYGLINPYAALTTPAPPSNATNPLLLAAPAPKEATPPAKSSTGAARIAIIAGTIAAIGAATSAGLYLRRKRPPKIRG
jgi:type VII secretion-associated serine protease mycosin